MVALFALAFLVIWRASPANSTPQKATSSTAAAWINQTWYVKGDSSIAAYSCASIDCPVVVILNSGSPVTIAGSLQGESLYPILYGSTTLYVPDFWLGRQSPLIQPPGIIPRGATATCKDGWTSYSQNRSGTCSHHKGVKTWSH